MYTDIQENFLTDFQASPPSWLATYLHFSLSLFNYLTVCLSVCLSNTHTLTNKHTDLYLTYSKWRFFELCSLTSKDVVHLYISQSRKSSGARPCDPLLIKTAVECYLQFHCIMEIRRQLSWFLKTNCWQLRQIIASFISYCSQFPVNVYLTV